MKKNLHFFQENLSELKSRTIKSLIFFFVFFVFFFFNSNWVLNFFSESLIKKLESQKFEIVFSSLLSPFSLKIDLAFIMSLYFFIPFLIYQIYAFVSPGLYKKEKKKIFPYLFFSPLLFFLANIFVFYLILPNVQNFFLNLSSQVNLDGKIKMMINVNEYLKMCFQMFVLFGLAFQFPLILKILLDFEILNVSSLKKSRKFVIVFIFIISAVLTPPDVLSQIFLAIPLIFLYEFIIFINKSKKKIVL